MPLRYLYIDCCVTIIFKVCQMGAVPLCQGGPVQGVSKVKCVKEDGSTDTPMDVSVEPSPSTHFLTHLTKHI